MTLTIAERFDERQAGWTTEYTPNVQQRLLYSFLTVNKVTLRYVMLTNVDEWRHAWHITVGNDINNTLTKQRSNMANIYQMKCKVQ